MSTIEREVQVVPEVLTEREQRARTLEAAALEIEVRGWAQGSVCRPDGSVCAVGAIHYATPRAESFYYNADLIWYGHAEEDVADYADIDLFNDRSAKSADDVTFLLRWRAEEIRDGR